MHDLEAVFAADGALARAIPGYRLRAQQIEMARAIAAAIEGARLFIAEAGTGTGKTFAYLVPALLARGKVIISTGTKTLQDQLYLRDLPTVRAALAISVTAALLKGRANYVCHHHLERTRVEGRFLGRDEVDDLHRVMRFALATHSGDKAELADVPEDASIWPRVTSTRENCLGQDCAFYKECFVMRARKAALDADVVVVNHHLFFADIVLREEGVAELLPACNTVIFDEAHQLPEVATLFFGESLSTGQLLELVRETRIEAARLAGESSELSAALERLDKAARDVRLSVPLPGGRMAAAQLERQAGFAAALEALRAALSEFVEATDRQRERSEGLQNCFERGTRLLAGLLHWRDEEAADLVRWAEVFNQSVQLSLTPIRVAEPFRRQLEGYPRAWIFTSATLAVGGDFSHYQAEMGLEHADTAAWESPFDFGNHALLYVPEDMPNPNSTGYTQAMVQAALPLLTAARGRAFFLLTTLRAMREAHALLSREFAARSIEFPLLLQGERSRSEQLEAFRRLGNAVLVGSHTFWEGVDVKGEALCLVVIDKLPFAPPDDPIVAARVQALERSGRNGFMDYQLPEAIITLKQGAGRLIRDEYDRGVLMICDPRLVSKPYGRRIWRSLPAMRRTRSLETAEAFLRDL